MTPPAPNASPWGTPRRPRPGRRHCCGPCVYPQAHPKPATTKPTGYSASPSPPRRPAACSATSSCPSSSRWPDPRRHRTRPGDPSGCAGIGLRRRGGAPVLDGRAPMASANHGHLRCGHGHGCGPSHTRHRHSGMTTPPPAGPGTERVSTEVSCRYAQTTMAPQSEVDVLVR
jgi:hypothetical protein